MFKRFGFLLAVVAISLSAAPFVSQAAERHRKIVKNRATAVVHITIRDRRLPKRPYGTYSGNVNIIQVPGLGSWSYGYIGRLLRPALEIPSAKIIDVGSALTKSPCSMEAGVCVIRP